MRLNWRKVIVLILVCELLMLYWSTLQHKEAVRQIQEQNLQQERPVSAAPQTAERQVWQQG
ncbi:hypothetical protein SD70_17850 [Gordoniibacillus kamchatkensis]|uniref:Uncharacterized protein n=1 Tax=Gordoniibacillus kamchatkensis TaxID=1590651 RepID=A0ABR5AFV1_9BACL|nr:hypothetical protein [Paenibacillus sp. VKM B-2647]KIL39772.1 hypothetical protein SD70_17850 [Paenibacillus sp. VKM B-2647]